MCDISLEWIEKLIIVWWKLSQINLRQIWGKKLLKMTIHIIDISTIQFWILSGL